MAKQEIKRLSSQPKLFDSEYNEAVDTVFASLQNANIHINRPEIIFGNIYATLYFSASDKGLLR